MKRNRVMFVTGTRAEFGLMTHTLRCLRGHPRLDLQLVVTGMHLSRAHGYSVRDIRQQGWSIDETVPWRGDRAQATGDAIAGLARAFKRLNPDVVLIVGDRVEAYAAATAAHLDGRLVAHVHGGDRALGQVDDALRHAITKLAHVHFPATAASAQRLLRLGEDAFRIHPVGTPGLDDLPTKAGCRTRDVLVLLHPDDADDVRQTRQARRLLAALKTAGVRSGVIVYPNNDPGWQGIAAAWKGLPASGWVLHETLPRDAFLSVLASCAFLIGNSSSGIIEAASLGTRVIDIGDRQLGRETSANVVRASWGVAALARAIRQTWNNGRPTTFRGRNVYGGGAAGRGIADTLARLIIDDRLKHKLIAY